MGKPSAPTIGYWYRPAFHIGITPRKVDAVTAFFGGDKEAWRGSITETGTVNVNAPNLWGGEKDQGGMVGDIDVMFGDADQMPNDYLVATFGDQTAAWRGCTTFVWKGGRYGAMNPYPQPIGVEFRRIKEGWDGDVCWYPEKAEVTVQTATGDPVSGYFQVEVGSYYTLENEVPNYGTVTEAYIATADEIGMNAIAARNAALGDSYTFSGSQYTELHGHPAIVAWDASVSDTIGIAAVRVTPVCPAGYEYSIAEGEPEHPTPYLDAPVVVCTLPGVVAANPAHVLYETLIDSEMGREPIENIDDTSFRAGADKFFAAGFGICPKRDPGQESVEDFQKRIGKLAACSISRSVVDGKWYLDLAWGDYDVDALPIITDDDILSFKMARATLDGAVNSAAVKYFDPMKNASTVTPAVRSLALVAQYGTIHQTYEYPEIPTGGLAARVAQREMQATTTPTAPFDMVCKPTIYKLRPNQYFRLQAPKRGIADMVCLVGSIEHGSLKSGAIKLKATQDIYGMPDSSFVQVEPGVDTRPPATPNAIALQTAFEAPYRQIAATLSRADLAALPDDVGFAMAAAAAPAGELDFTMMADAGAGYEDVGTGHWAATATVNEAASRIATSFTLANGKQLAQVVVGMAAVWDGELVRVDAIDGGAGTITLGRACADTTPQLHAANSRLWFYEVGFGYDTTEYTDGETVDFKLLSRTGSQLLPIGSATPLEIEFHQRQARPYPPAKLRINGEADPVYLFDTLAIAWVHRDRIQQADQLVDTEAATIGPEAGTTYTVRTYIDNVLDGTQSAIAGTSATVAPSGDGTVRIEVEAVRDGITSWQANTREFAYTAAELDPLEMQDGSVLQTQSGDTIYLQG